MKSIELDVKTSNIADLIVRSSKIVVFTGAGVSTESGIPDFRSPGGVWSKFDPEDFTIQKFMSDPESRRKQWNFLINDGLFTSAQPNQAHLAVAELEKLGRLDCIITQNIDNLHQNAGNSPEKVFELHGNMNWVRCLSCNTRYPMERIRERLQKGEEIPDCENCNGLLKPDVVLFGEALPQDVITNAVNHARNCDLLIVIGSSLVVSPASYIPAYATDAGAKLVIINMTSTTYDYIAAEVIHEKAGIIMQRILGNIKMKI